jgi:hypothetical protein
MAPSEHGLRIKFMVQLTKTCKLVTKVNQRQDVEPATSFFDAQNVSAELLISMACASDPWRSLPKYTDLLQK